MKKIIKSDEEWCAKLTSEQCRVSRKGGTEPPFSGEYDDFYENGIYKCVSCDLPLFSSKTKFHSGTGWPSFWDPIAPDHIEEREDRGWGMVRTEILCARCNAHLGHVFEDGPEPTGLRYCINSLSLKFEETGDEE